MWLGTILILAGMVVSVIGVVKAVRSKFTDLDAIIWVWAAVPIIYIGTAIATLL